MTTSNPRVWAFTTLSLAVLAAAPPASAQTAAAPPAAPPSVAVALDYPDAPPATVELDLGEGMVGDVFGIGRAALTGVVRSLAEATASSAGHDNTHELIEHLGAVNEMTELLGGVVHVASIRVYEDLPEGPEQGAAMLAYYEKKLAEAQWDGVLRVREGNKQVRVSLHRADGAVRGVFLVACEGEKAVVASVACDLSPANIERLTALATKTGMQLGLEKGINKAMEKLKAQRDAR